MNNVVSKNTETKKIRAEVVLENIEVVKEQEQVLNEVTNVNVNINIKVKKEKSTGLKRDIIDKFYTTEATVNKCMSLVRKHIVIEDNDLCIEPSAGDGSFIKLIKRMFKNYIFYDIKPDHKEIIEKDYLCIDENCKKCNEYNKIKNQNYNKIHIIGNPPFGRQSSLAIKFIKTSSKFCDSISFILPKSFKKDSLKSHIDSHFHLKYECELPDDAFTVNNEKYNVPCVFQIWVKEENPRIIPLKLSPNKYSFVKKDENPDISFRRVGINAGKTHNTDIDKKSIQSHYFIKFDEPLSDELYKKIELIDFTSKNDTVGPRSISKQELIKEFNKIIT